MHTHLIQVDVKRSLVLLRQGVAWGLRLLAERLRPEEAVAGGTVGADATWETVAVAPEPVAVPEPEPPVATEPAADEAAPVAALAGGDLREQIVEVLKTVFDPEIPVDIYALGLIYSIAVDEKRTARVEMTLTSPNCPAAAALPSEVELKVGALEGIDEVVVDVVFDPPWTPDLMSEEAKLELNLA